MEAPDPKATGCHQCPAPYLAIVRTFLPSSWPKLKCSCADAPLLFTFGSGRPWSVSSTVNRKRRMPRRLSKFKCLPSRFVAGDAAGRRVTSRWRINQDAGESSIFPPLDRAIVQALACELLYKTEQPLSRQSVADLTLRARAALQKPISSSTVWRILHDADLKPWRYQYWIFPRDPRFAEKAEVILDLYAGFWRGKPLGRNDYIISSDEKTSIQARIRCHPCLNPAPGRPRRIEFEYERGGALQYLAAWDVRRGYIMGRCESTTGINPFGHLVAQVMEQEPYRSAKRVFWVVDNGSSHRGQASIKRLAKSYSNGILVHTPIHASWLNQVEIYFSKIQRKVLTPNDFTSLAEVEERLRLYEALTNQNPRPFNWKFDRAKLTRFLGRLHQKLAA
jgi:DDE superfamily endonuclease